MTKWVGQRRRVLVVLPSRADFLELYRNEGPCGSMLLPKEPPSDGEAVEVEVVFLRELMTFHIRGVTQAAGQDAASVTVVFDASETRGRDIIVEFANGRNIASLTRRARRYPIALEVEYADDDEFFRGLTIDLNSSGAHIVGEWIPKQHTLLALRLPVPNQNEPLCINAEVAWASPHKHVGFGVMFLVGDEHKRATLQKIIEQRMSNGTSS